MPLGWGVWGVNIAISCGSIARGLSQVRPSWPGGKSSGRVIIAASRGISARADLSQITHNDDAFAFSGEDICVTSCEGLPVIVRPSSWLAMSDNCISASNITFSFAIMVITLFHTTYKCHVKRNPILSSPNVL